MVTIKVKFRPSPSTDLPGSIYYQLTRDRKVRQIMTDMKVYRSEWDERRSVAIWCRGERKAFILSVRERVRMDCERIMRIFRRLESAGPDYTVDDVADEFRRYSREFTLMRYMERMIAALKRNGRIRSSETYRSALNSFRKFLTAAGGDLCKSEADIMLDSISPELMESYESWQKKRGVTANTISFYNRILRAVYNRAVDGGIIENRLPFRHVYTGVDKTVKRALPLTAIKRIKALDLTGHPELDFARDMFMMSFYFRGMSFIDMAYLRKKDLRQGYITYRRRKTGRQLIIEWTGEMQLILDKYPVNPTEYLLPVIRRQNVNERCAYRNAGYNINHSLKRIAGMAGISVPLTLYVARHSWASAAKAKGVPLSVISEGMGHDNEATTRIYLTALDTSVVDRANGMIIKSLR